MNKDKWINKNCTNLIGKTICITGSTGGIAKYFTEIFASFGANFIFANRNLQKSEKQKQEILAKYPNCKIQIFEVDMSDINSIKIFAHDIKNIKIDILILNAAIYNVKVFQTNLGYNNIFQVNFISPYFLVKQLLPQLEKNYDSKVIVLGSIAHKFQKLNLTDLDYTKNAKTNKIYGNSKRFLMFSLYKLFLNKKTKLSIVHPGITLTNMTNHYHKLINWFVKIGISLVFPSPQKACLSIVKGAYDSTNEGEWIGPKMLNIWGYPKKQKLKKYKTDEAETMFQLAENIYSKIKTPKA